MRGSNQVALRIGIGVACATAWVLAPAACASDSESTADPEARAIMAEIVDALQTLLPLSLDANRYGSPENRAEIDAALEKLSANSGRLKTHGAARDSGFAFLSGTLARDSDEIRTRFADGRVAQSRFLLHHLTETCIACHSRLPDDRPHPLGTRLTEDAAIAALPTEERVQLEIATRQFDRALASYESLFRDPATSLAEIDLTGHFESYLEICLRVQEDPDRAISQLEDLLGRPDLPDRLSERMRSWVAALRAHKEPVSGSPLERARALMGSDIDSHTTDDSQLVALIAASGILHRYVAAADRQAAGLGEAYYLLGVIESRIGRSFWASQTEHFLEAAIRVGPGRPYAESAFDLLEELLISGFTGSSGTHIPQDLIDRMDELQQLIANARQS